jgi:hypothetical protein
MEDSITGDLKSGCFLGILSDSVSSLVLYGKTLVPSRNLVESDTSKKI